VDLETSSFFFVRAVLAVCHTVAHFVEVNAFTRAATSEFVEPAKKQFKFFVCNFLSSTTHAHPTSSFSSSSLQFVANSSLASRQSFTPLQTFG
jgi:hypothetical protein